MLSTRALPALSHAPVLIIGTGIAGLMTALKFAEDANVSKVFLLCKSDRWEGSTRYAQGGIASVWSKQDSFEEHQHDTLNAGAGLCHRPIVQLCVQEGPERVRELIELGVEFTKKEDWLSTDPAEVFDLHREGGHGQRRILHSNDGTGLAIQTALLKRVEEHPKIELFEQHVVVDLITEGKTQRVPSPGRCVGAYVLDITRGEIVTISSSITVLATGGAGKAYLYTSNPDTSTGDGIAVAHRAGATVANLEFIQFHPTCLFHPEARGFLITEALRGEGAVLKNKAGQSFMERYHPMASLAPRDIVARAIDAEMKKTGDPCAFLDCRSIPAEEFRKKFPTIHEMCMKHGIDPTQVAIPVVPAAHYTCGGIQTDEWAQTSIEGLFAVGEVACTGLHGANRLASNSLLEALVFAHRASLCGKELLARFSQDSLKRNSALPTWDSGGAIAVEDRIDIAASWMEIRSLMWNYVGIVRSDRRLTRARKRLELLRQEVNAYYWNLLLNKDLVELRNLLTVAELIVQCASSRKESRGLHYTVDYPKTLPAFERDTVIQVSP